MRSLVLRALFAFAVLSTAGPISPVRADSPPSDPPPPDWSPRVWTDHPLEIRLEDPAVDLERLRELLGPDPIRREALRPSVDGSWTLRIRGDSGLEAHLRQGGFRFDRTEDRERRGRKAVEAAWASRDVLGRRAPFDFPLDTYPTHAEVGQILDDLAAAHPDLARTFEWGNSVEGRLLRGLVISDDVHATEAEPEVRLAAGIHGDETVQMINLLNLAHELLERYGQSGYEDLTALVDGTEIHFMPLINPDGYVSGFRYNANFYDLNRNFPEPTGQHSSRQPETLEFMDHALAHDFVISGTGHGGALVVNYPWDHTYTRAPDDDALIALSLEYSQHNLPMYNGSFPQGITNGADWYVVDGSLQDWSYAVTGCIDLTLEVSNTKWPAASSLPGYWNDNRQSLISFVAAARYGIHGVVTDAATGDPLDSVVTVVGNAKPVTTDPEHGDYYKLLDTGTHDVVFEAVGYDPVTVTDVTTVWGTPTVLDVALSAEGTSSPSAPLAHDRIEAISPNPFNPTTEIAFRLAQRSPVRVEVRDARGRGVRRLVDGVLEGGMHTLRWDGRDDRGIRMGSGVYFVSMETPRTRRTAKAVLLE